MMGIKKALVPILVCALLFAACDYIVLPEEDELPSPTLSKGWSAVVTKVGTSDTGDLRVDLTLRNETGDWSAMQVAADKPAVLTTGDGKTTNCDTFVGTGGHRLAPGFQIRGYTGGTIADPKIELVRVECKDATAAAGSKLAFDYSYVTGEYNYYYPEANQASGRVELDLDQVTTDFKYPLAEPIEGLIQKPDAEITAINKVVLALKDVRRTDKGLEFMWQTTNPSEYPAYVHIGNPPVVGEDGILYGVYQTPDIVSVPITPASGTAEWTTQVAVPENIRGFYIMLSVESKKQRLFVNYAVNISDK